MITMTHLRALLERALTHTENPAILRLPEEERTVEGLAGAYLARRIYWLRADGVTDETCHAATLSALRCWGAVVSTRLDLTDSGTARTLLVALALALGLDPGVGGLSVRWTRYDNPGPADMAEHAWIVWGGDMLRNNTAIQFASNLVNNKSPRVLLTPAVAAEPAPVRSLALALTHVLENP
jgi:hypothetical protein